jgi:hypothetical protein
MMNACRARGAPAELSQALEVHADRERLRELFDIYIGAAPNDMERLVLIYDELDAYAPFGRPFFNQIEDIRKNSNGRLVVFAAGGLGLAALDTLLGSSFFSRMDPGILEPFNREEIARLAEPFERCGSPLSPEVLDALWIASGGNLALTTFGLQHLWPIEAPDAHHVTEIFAEFRATRSLTFLNKIRDPIFASDLSNAPMLVWCELERSGGEMTRARLLELVKNANGDPSVKKPEWVFRMLRSSGLIRCSDEACHQRNIKVEIIPSILTFDALNEPSQRGTLREQLVADLSEVLASIHRMSADFFDWEKKNNKQIVHEAVFSAALCLGLDPRGWKVEREAQSAAGRTDIKARHIDFEGQWVVIEVKIWLRHDHENIHAQVTSYWSEGVDALATVMVADLQDPDWPDTYEAKCLKGKAPTYTRKDAAGALAGHFVSETGKTTVREVDHFLLKLARRR